MTEADPEDPLKEQYGDATLVQSQAMSGRVWTLAEELTPALKDQQVNEAECLIRQAFCRSMLAFAQPHAHPTQTMAVGSLPV